MELGTRLKSPVCCERSANLLMNEVTNMKSRALINRPTTHSHLPASPLDGTFFPRQAALVHELVLEARAGTARGFPGNPLVQKALSPLKRD